ncbi:MAG: enoyl-CoA hydratase [Bacteroidetes bacterium]|nr:MAG: enoyl-CoA hydratase [Bacteroidota bacterium]
MIYSQEQTTHIYELQFAHLLVEEKGHVLTLTLNRPAQKNALSPTLVRELAFAMSYAHHHTHIRVVVLAAEGDTFCAGADMKAFLGGEVASASTIPPEPKDVVIGDLFHQIHRPVIVRVQGDVWAGGFLLICGGAYVVASEGARFGLPEVKRGLWPMQVTASLLQIMPRRKALDFCLRARTIFADEALELGLVTHVVPPDALDALVGGLATELSGYSPTAIRMGLEAVDQLRFVSQENQHAFLRDKLRLNLVTRDAQEGMRAFAEKRPPVWTGE